MTSEHNAGDHDSGIPYETVVDVHHHYVPRSLAVAGGWSPGETVHVVRDGQRIVTLHDRVVDLESHVVEMDIGGVETAVLSCFVGWDETPEVCRMINDDMARQSAASGGRFEGFAHLPTEETGAAIAELDRVTGELGLPGVSVMTKLDGRFFDDPSLAPLWAEIERRRLPVFVHPVMLASGHEGTADFDLSRIIAREFDLVTTATRVIASGLFDRFPGLCFILSHLGGGISAIKERIANKAYRFGTPLEKGFPDYFGRLNVDMAGFEGGHGALACALTGFAPSQLVFGTDCPQDFSGVTTDTGVGPEGIRSYLETIWALDLSEAERRAMIGGNWRRLAAGGAGAV